MKRNVIDTFFSKFEEIQSHDTQGNCVSVLLDSHGTFHIVHSREVSPNHFVTDVRQAKCKAIQNSEEFWKAINSGQYKLLTGPKDEKKNPLHQYPFGRN